MSEKEANAFRIEDVEKVYLDLKRIARQIFRGERSGHTLQTTAVVNEAWIRMMGEDWEDKIWNNPAHFFRTFAMHVRWVLIEHARRKAAAKRGGGWEKLPYDDPFGMIDNDPEQLILIDQLLEEMAKAEDLDKPERKVDVFCLKAFAGLEDEAVAEVLKPYHDKVSTPTVKRDWRMAKAWLTREARSVREKAS